MNSNEETPFLIDNNGCLKRYEGNNIKVIIPNNIASIGEGAFEYNCNIEEVVIPEGVTIIKKDAFHECENLKCVVFPKSLAIIGENAFLCDRKIEELVLQEGLTIIKKNAFAFCDGLKRVYLPKSIKTIEESAFLCENEFFDYAPMFNEIFNPGYNTMVNYNFETHEFLEEFQYVNLKMINEVIYAGSSDDFYKITVSKRGNGSFLMARKKFLLENSDDDFDSKRAKAFNQMVSKIDLIRNTFDGIVKKYNDNFYIYDYQDLTKLENLFQETLSIGKHYIDKELIKILGIIDAVIKKYKANKDNYISNITYEMEFKAYLQSIKNISEYIKKRYLHHEKISPIVFSLERAEIIGLKYYEIVEKREVNFFVTIYFSYFFENEVLYFSLYDFLKLDVNLIPTQFSYKIKNDIINSFVVKNESGNLKCFPDDRFFTDEAWNL